MFLWRTKAVRHFPDYKIFDFVIFECLIRPLSLSTLEYKGKLKNKRHMKLITSDKDKAVVGYIWSHNEECK